MRTVKLPAPVLGLLLALVLAFAVQGWRMAADRQARLEPSRAVGTLRLGTAPARFARAPHSHLVVDPGTEAPARLGLYQLLAERPLLRWLEPAQSRARDWLVVPLDGLGPGRYALCAVDSDASAGPREMDLPELELDVRARFDLE